MARVDPGGRIILDNNSSETLPGWAILVHGKTRPDLLFTSQSGAEAYRVTDHHLSRCEIVPVMVTGDIVTRIGSGTEWPRR